MDDIYAKLAEILEVERVSPDDILSSFEYWDSLTVLSILAMLDAGYGANLTAGELRQMTRAADLADVVEERRRK
jgi:acyl carrier protein